MDNQRNCKKAYKFLSAKISKLPLIFTFIDLQCHSSKAGALSPFKTINKNANKPNNTDTIDSSSAFTSPSYSTNFIPSGGSMLEASSAPTETVK
jgi:hypothetical protein